MPEIHPLIQESRQLFSDTPRPESFCRNPNHCEECQEHEETLQANDIDSIGTDQLGNPGWEPMAFVSVDGFKYYFPALVRLTLEGKTDGVENYIESFLTQIVLDGPRNERVNSFSIEQKQFVRRLLLELIELYRDKIVEWPSLEIQFDQALKVWSDDSQTEAL